MPTAPRYEPLLFDVRSEGKTYRSMPPMVLDGPDNTITQLGNLIPAPGKDDEPR
jgi:hypothetical protein